MRYKNYIFDFGNVLYYFEPTQILSKYTDSQDDITVLKEIIFPQWDKLDKGLIEYDEYMDNVLSKVPKTLKATTKTIFNTWHRALSRVEGVFDVIKDIKADGHFLYLLSNAPAVLDDFIHTYPESEYFDGIVISGIIKMVKPDEQIYRYILDKYRLLPQETLFIDDKKPNIESAKTLGINVHLFDGDIEKLRKAI